MVNTLQNLYSDLDDAVSYCLRRIADHHEERGDLRMAKAWRWIAENGLRPRIYQSPDKFLWNCYTYNRSELTCSIPQHIAVASKAYGIFEFDTQSEAYQWLADLVAKWQDSQTKNTL